MLIVLLLPSLLSSETVTVTTLPDYKPFCYHKEGQDGSQEEISPGQESALFTGLAWEIVLASFHAVDYTVKLSIVPWARGMYQLDTGGTDLLFPAVKIPNATYDIFSPGNWFTRKTIL